MGKTTQRPTTRMAPYKKQKFDTRSVADVAGEKRTETKALMERYYRGARIK